MQRLRFLYFTKGTHENTQRISSWRKEAFSKHCLDLNLNDQETGHFYLCIPGIPENSIFQIKIIFPCIFNYLWTFSTFCAWIFLFFLCQIFSWWKRPKKLSIRILQSISTMDIYWVVSMKVVDELSPDENFYQNADLCSGQLLIVDSMAHPWLLRPLRSNEGTEAK